MFWLRNKKIIFLVRTLTKGLPYVFGSGPGGGKLLLECISLITEAFTDVL